MKYKVTFSSDDYMVILYDNSTYFKQPSSIEYYIDNAQVFPTVPGQVNLSFNDPGTYPIRIVLIGDGVVCEMNDYVTIYPKTEGTVSFKTSLCSNERGFLTINGDMYDNPNAYSLMWEMQQLNNGVWTTFSRSSLPNTLIGPEIVGDYKISASI